MYETGLNYYSQSFSPYFSTSLRYGFVKSFKRVTTELSLEILNLTNNQPILEYRFDGQNLREVRPFGMVPIFGMSIIW